jgi:hypothetical protein
MNLTAEQIQENWEKFLENINTHISSPRKEALLNFYTRNQERLILMPASPSTKFHNCFPGGYIEHVNRVVEASLRIYEVWKDFGCDTTAFTVEELVFAAINHDLGKIGDSKQELYRPSQDEWRKKNLGEVYSLNHEIPFMTIPDRSLFLLQEAGIKVSMNEMIAIRTHDGLYDECNKPYLISRMPESRPKSVIPFILHQADHLASVVELTVNKGDQPQAKKFAITNSNTGGTKQQQIKNKALSNIKSEGLKDVMSNFFEQ